MAEYDVVENLLEGEPTGGVTIPDASTTAKGIAQFNPDDFTVEAETAKVSALQKVGIPQYIGSVVNITGNEIAVQLSTNSTKPVAQASLEILFLFRQTIRMILIVLQQVECIRLLEYCRIILYIQVQVLRFLLKVLKVFKAP